MICRNYDSSSIKVSGDSLLFRKPPRPLHLRQDGYEDRFDYSTMWYDCFQHASNDSVVLLGPPMLNLAVPLSQGVFRAGGDKIRSVKARQMCKVHQVIIPVGGAIEEIEFDCGPYSATLKVQPTQAERFANRRVLFTVSKNNPLSWLRDWAEYHVRNKGVAKHDFMESNIRSSSTQK